MAQRDLLNDIQIGKLPVRVYLDQTVASVAVANRMAALIREGQKYEKPVVFGLATGMTPVRVYAELVRMHREEGLSFRNVFTFNLDEYYPMHPDATHSYVRFMNEHLFNHVDIPAENIHIPDGQLAPEDIAGYCLNYENKIKDLGGLDFMLLGIGLTGHIGFNEPGSDRNSGMRLVELADLTRGSASDTFGGEGNVPKMAITMGVRTILNAREIVLMAWSQKKADIIREAIEGEISANVPATYLQLADRVKVVLDHGAASGLTGYNSGNLPVERGTPAAAKATGICAG